MGSGHSERERAGRVSNCCLFSGAAAHARGGTLPHAVHYDALSPRSIRSTASKVSILEVASLGTLGANQERQNFLFWTMRGQGMNASEHSTY